VLYSLFVDISNLQNIEMQVQAFYVSHDNSYQPYSSFKKLKSIYAGVGDSGLIGFIIMYI